MSARRIAFLLPHFRVGGAERVVLNWIGAFDRARWQPLLLLGKAEGALLAQLPDDVPAVAIGGGRALRRPWRIADALAALRADVAYSATSAMNLALLAAPTRVPRIVSEHTPPDSFRREAKWPLVRAAATRLLTPRAAAVAVPTAAIGAAVRGAPVAVVRNPVLPAVPPPLAPKEDGTRIVAAGRLVPAKGFDTLIDAAALLAARNVRFTLDIFGEGPLHEALAAQIARHGIGHRVRLAGRSDALGAALAAADLVVSSSRREGFGNVIVEAMAAGTPVLATRAGGPETFVADGRNGFLVEADEPAALAMAIAALLADPARRMAVRAAARETAAGYTVAASLAEFTALLDRVLGEAAVKSKVTAAG